MDEFPYLLAPYTLKNVSLRNRLVMLPHVTFFASQDRRPSPRLKQYYIERARGGVGLIVTESQTNHNQLMQQLEGRVPALYSGGDALAPRNVFSPIVDGERVGRQI